MDSKTENLKKTVPLARENNEPTDSGEAVCGKRLWIVGFCSRAATKLFGGPNRGMDLEGSIVGEKAEWLGEKRLGRRAQVREPLFRAATLRQTEFGCFEARTVLGDLRFLVEIYLRQFDRQTIPLPKVKLISLSPLKSPRGHSPPLAICCNPNLRMKNGCGARRVENPILRSLDWVLPRSSGRIGNG